LTPRSRDELHDRGMEGLGVLDVLDDGKPCRNGEAILGRALLNVSKYSDALSRLFDRERK